MEPTRVHVARFLVAGLTVRTINLDEFKPESAKIPALWGRFFSDYLPGKIPNQSPETPVFGVYSAYESDASGQFNVTAGVSVTSPTPDFDLIEIQEGDYLVFEAHGPMPAAVIQAWMSVWTYFQLHPQVQRSFATDFEQYRGADAVQIHIGVAS